MKRNIIFTIEKEPLKQEYETLRNRKTSVSARFIIMRSPVQSRVPLLDKNKAFGRLPLLGAFFFLSLREIIVKSSITFLPEANVEQ